MQRKRTVSFTTTYDLDTGKLINASTQISDGIRYVATDTDDPRVHYRNYLNVVAEYKLDELNFAPSSYS